MMDFPPLKKKKKKKKTKDSAAILDAQVLVRQSVQFVCIAAITPSLT